MSDDFLGKMYSDGEVIFKEGDKAEMMYVIQSGKVEIAKDTPSGRASIATLHSGEVFGEMSLFDKLPRSATALASGATRVLSIDRKKLFKTINSDPTLVFKILETLSQRIRTLNRDLAELNRNKSGMLKMCFNLEDTCRMVLEEAKKIAPAENGSIMLMNEDGSLHIQAAFGTETASKLMLKIGDGIAGDVLQSGKAELIKDVGEDPRFKPGKAVIKSLLCVPLKCLGNNIGVINLSNCAERSFSIDDLKFLHSLSTYAAMAIQNTINVTSLNNATNHILRNATMLDV